MQYPNWVAPSYQPTGFQSQQYSQTYAMPQPNSMNSGTNLNQSSIIWVQGEAGAKSWAVAPGKSVMLMDSESNTFYIKSSDNSGMPMPLRIFDYTERNQQAPQQNQVAQHNEIDTSQFVTWDKLDERINQKLDEFTKPSGGNNNG